MEEWKSGGVETFWRRRRRSEPGCCWGRSYEGCPAGCYLLEHRGGGGGKRERERRREKEERERKRREKEREMDRKRERERESWGRGVGGGQSERVR